MGRKKETELEGIIPSAVLPAVPDIYYRKNTTCKARETNFKYQSLLPMKEKRSYHTGLFCFLFAGIGG